MSHIESKQKEYTASFELVSTKEPTENGSKESGSKENKPNEHEIKEIGLKENKPNENIIKENGTKENGTKENGTVENSVQDEEDNLPKVPYPKSVFFIISNEFCERFNYYGMRTILVLYLTNILLYDEPTAKVLYHTFSVLVYFFPIIGAIISDSFLGKFRTILYLSIVYATGSVVLALASARPVHLPQEAFSIVGLLLIAMGTGGIKPCVSAFGGDQFVLPQQEIPLARFFSLFYFSVNAGSLISTFLTPVLRNNVHCFDEDSCFPLAFAVPGALMILSVIIFVLGKPLYKIKQPQGNVIVQVCKCITHALTKKFKTKEVKDHWLDHAEGKYGTKLVSDIKAALKVLFLYIPLPIFWTLYDQQGSAWTFQAVRMDGDIGFYTILPDQIQVVNPLLILAFIPMFSYGVYPLFARCNFLKTPLQRMVVGGFFAAVAFIITALVSMALERTYPVLPSSGNAQLRVYNPSSCNVTVRAADLNINEDLPQFGYHRNIDVTAAEPKNITFTFDSECHTYENIILEVVEKTAYGIYLTKNGAVTFEDSVGKSEDGFPKVRTLAYDTDVGVVYKRKDDTLEVEPGNFTLKSLPSPGSYDVEGFNRSISFKLGGTYSIMLNNDIQTRTSTVVVTEPNSVHMLWQLPQYVILTAGEIMFSITGLEFSYSQAPASMKSLITACFLLTMAIGNVIIIIIESAKIFEKQSNDFFLYTGLMVADMLLFTYMAWRYVYVIPEDTDTESKELTKPEEEKKMKNGIENPSFTTADNAKE